MELIKKFEKNTKGKDYVVGDIHGMFSLLESELDRMSFDRNVDRLFCVGDLVDRGSESPAFLRWLSFPWFHSVRGNHEDLLIGNYLNGREDRDLHIQNGGEWFEDCSNGLRKKMYEACIELPYIIEVESVYGLVGILHADTGYSEDWDEIKTKVLEEQTMRNTLLWSRLRVTAKNRRVVEGVDRIYVGHTPMENPTILGNFIYIDTGAVFDEGHFTIREL